MCHYCPTRAKHLGDLWIAAPTTQEQRHGVNFLPNFAAVVLEKAKVQQSTCHYCQSRAKQLGDLWIAAPTTLELHPDVNFFWQMLLPWSGERYAKNTKVQQC